MKLSFLRGRLARRGWEYRDSFPTDLKQYVLVFGPHTHSKDFWAGLCIREDLGLHHLHVLGKKPLFRGIQGWFLRQLGGIPVDQHAAGGVVGQVVEHFKNDPNFCLALAPEGTRAKVDGLRSGYYEIAKAAGVPIVVLGIDAGRKVVSISAPIMPLDTKEATDARVLEILGPLEGFVPEKGLQHLTPDRASRLMPEQLAWNAQTFPHRLFLDQPVEGGRIQFTNAEAYAEAACFARGLYALGVKPGDRVALIGKNSAHWLIYDYGVSLAGAVSVPIYPTIDAPTARAVLEHSESKVVVLGKLDDVMRYRDCVPHGIAVVTTPDHRLNGDRSWDEVCALGDPNAALPTLHADDLMTVIYTSGTTGMPKGVMHSYRNFQEAFRIILTQFDFLHQEVFLSYLPLCHVAERMIISAAGVYLTGRVHFVQSLETFAADLERAQPTVFLAVPRIWEKFSETLHRKLPAAWLRRALAPVLRKKLGLSRARLVLSGAAPIRASLLDEFASLGIVIQEVYGMTENLGITTVNFRGKVRIGSVGQPFAGTRVFLGDGDEILLESPTNTLGYYREPELTAELFRGGALHTGDVGRFDADGYLFITGRIKDIFKTAKGKYVAPAPIEGRIMEADEVEQVCLFGVNLPQPVALTVLTEHALNQAREAVEHRLQQLLDAINRELPQHERIAQLIVVRERWEIDNGFITPSLKIKRNQVEQFYHDLVHGLAAKVEKVVWA
jgi:long-chain acyl-CoA synthetase